MSFFPEYSFLKNVIMYFGWQFYRADSSETYINSYCGIPGLSVFFGNQKEKQNRDKMGDTNFNIGQGKLKSCTNIFVWKRNTKYIHLL